MSIKEIPGLVIEFKDLARDYLVQETLGPAKSLGHLLGFSLGAALLWAFAVLLLAVAAMRGIIALLPEGTYWEALGYLLTVILLVGLAAILFAVGPRSPALAETEEAS